MLRPLITSLALATFAVAISYQAASTTTSLEAGDPDTSPAAMLTTADAREAWFVPDGADRRFVDDEGCVVTCARDVQHEFDEVCIRECEVSQ